MNSLRRIRKDAHHRSTKPVAVWAGLESVPFVYTILSTQYTMKYTNPFSISPYMTDMQRNIRQISFAIGLCALLLGALAATTHAQSGVEDVSADEVNVVARELWCPLCSGVRLDSCELTACDQMKDEIAIRLAEGQDTEAIKAYFIEQYGPQVLGEPPREGFNWLAWILPFAALIGGGAFLWTRLRGMVQPAAATTEAHAAAPDDEPDEYEQKLEDELRQYG